MPLILIFRQRQRDHVPVADYDVDVKIASSSTMVEPIAEVIVRGHRRDDGWPVLVARFLKQHHLAALRRVMNE